MAIPKYKVKLSPKLQLGVGRSTGRGSILPYASIMLFVISGVLGIRAITKVINPDQTVIPDSGQVLGATDSTANTQPFKDYIVKKGDTVFSIGQTSNVDWTTIATLNNLSAPFKLSPGQTLKLPNQ